MASLRPRQDAQVFGGPGDLHLRGSREDGGKASPGSALVLRDEEGDGHRLGHVEVEVGEGGILLEGGEDNGKQRAEFNTMATSSAKALRKIN